MITAAHSARVSAVANELVAKDPTAAVIVCGSQVEGVGNALSDIDMLVIHDSEAASADGWRHRPGAGALDRSFFDESLGVDGDLLDVEHLYRGDVDALVARVNALPPGRRTVAEYVDLEQYYRFMTGEVLDGAATAVALRRPMDFSHLQLLLSSDADARLSSLLRRASGWQRLGIDALSIESAETAVSWAIQGHLFEAGDLFPPRKWRFEKLARTFGPDAPLLHEAWDLKKAKDCQRGLYFGAAMQFISGLRPGVFAEAEPVRAEVRCEREYLIAEYRFSKDIADVKGALEAEQLGMASHALGRVTDRLADAWLLLLGSYDRSSTSRRLIVTEAAAHDATAARIHRLRSDRADLAEMSADAEQCQGLATELGFVLAAVPSREAIGEFAGRAAVGFTDAAEFRRWNHDASVGIDSH